MKHLALILIVLVFGNKTQEESMILESNYFSSHNLEHEVITQNPISIQDNQTFPTPVRVKFYPNTTQEQINESLDSINPNNSFRCVDSAPNDQIYVLFITGNGRGNGSGGSGNDDNVIQSDPHIQSYRFGKMCE